MKEQKSVRKLLRQWDRLSCKDGILRRSVKENGHERQQLLLPASLKPKLLKALHDDVGHQASQKTLELARRRCYWPDMMKDII